MKIETVPVADLTPFEKNPRRHPEKQIKEILRSLEQFGQYRPLVVDEENVVLAGNGLLTALKRQGAETARVTRVTGLTKEQRSKLVLTDNRVGDLSNDDFYVVEELMRALAEAGDDLDIAGYDSEAVSELVATLDEVQESADSYGTLPEEEIEKMQRQAEKVEQQAQDAELRPVQTDALEGEEPEETPAHAVENEDSGSSEDVPSGDVCPTCHRPW